MKNDFWNKFVSTGSVQDYLNYKQNEKSINDFLGIVGTDANNNQGTYYKGTDNRGE